MHQPVDVVLQPDKRAEAGELGDLPFDEVADLVKLVDLVPRILRKLLDADGDALVFAVDLEHLCLDFQPLLQHLGRVVDLAGPGNVGNVDHGVESLLEPHEGAVAGEVANLTAHLCANLVFLLGQIPRVGVELADAEGDFLLVLVDAEHDGLDVLAGLEHLGRLVDALGPRQFADMHQPLDSRLQLDKRAVRHEVDHPASNLAADGVFLLDLVPGIGLFLFQAEADPLALLVDVEDDHLKFLAGGQHLGGMRDAAPAHVGDVQQAVQAVQVDERAEVGQVLDCALADVARHHVVEQFRALGRAFLLDQFAAAEHDVLPLEVELHHLEIVGLTDVRLEVVRGGDVDLRRRQERLHADVHDQPALDRRLDAALDVAPLLADGLDVVPVLFEDRLLVGQHDHAVAILELEDQHVHLYPELQFLVVILEFVDRHGAFALVADVDHDILLADLNDRPLDYLAGGKADLALRHGLFHG